MSDSRQQLGRLHRSKYWIMTQMRYVKSYLLQIQSLKKYLYKKKTCVQKISPHSAVTCTFVSPQNVCASIEKPRHFITKNSLLLVEIFVNPVFMFCCFRTQLFLTRPSYRNHCQYSCWMKVEIQHMLQISKYSWPKTQSLRQHS